MIKFDSEGNMITRDELNDTNTIESTITAGKTKNPNLYNNLSILTRMNDKDGENKIDVPYDNILYMYLDELKSLSMKVKLNSTEMDRYKYRPDLLSYDLYGTTQYDYILLALNDIISPKYFDKEIVNIIDADYIELIVSSIADAEDEYIQLNRSQYTSEE